MPSYKQYMSMTAKEVASMTEKEMRAAVRSMQKVVGSRMSRLEKGGYQSQAARYMAERGKISTKGKDLNQLRAEFKQAKMFLQARTSTVTGVKRVMSEYAQGLQDAGISVTKGQAAQIFQAIDKIKANDPKAAGKGMKYALARAMSMDVEDGKTAEDYVMEFGEKLDEIYQEQAAAEQDFLSGGVSGYFEPF